MAAAGSPTAASQSPGAGWPGPCGLRVTAHLLVLIADRQLQVTRGREQPAAVTDRAVRTLHYCGLVEAMDLVLTSRDEADVRTAHDQRLLEVFRAMADADPQVTLYESDDQFSVHINLRDGPTPPK